MLVHLFGGASSPSCANYALNKTAEDNEREFDAITVETVRRNFYVVDCLRSVTTAAVAVFTVAWLAQLGECQSAEREVAGSNPGRTNTQGLQITEKKVLPL